MQEQGESSRPSSSDRSSSSGNHMGHKEGKLALQFSPSVMLF